MKTASAIMRRKEMLASVGLCYTHVYNMEKLGKFPARRQLGVRAVGWIREEIEAWIAGLGLACAAAKAAV